MTFSFKLLPANVIFTNLLHSFPLHFQPSHVFLPAKRPSHLLSKNYLVTSRFPYRCVVCQKQTNTKHHFSQPLTFIRSVLMMELYVALNSLKNLHDVVAPPPELLGRKGHPAQHRYQALKNLVYSSIGGVKKV